MIVGIDLGTTNSGVAIVKNGAPQMLPNGDERIIPSVVGVSPAGQWLVGTPLGDFLITDLEPEHPGELAQVTVRFDFDVNGILKVTAQDRHTGQQKDITVEASLARLSEAEIMEAQARVTEAIAPAAETRVLVERARRLLASDELEPEDRAELEELVADVQAAQNAGDTSRVEELLEELLDFLFDLEED